jgi:predicted transcriptional regulator
MYIIEKSNYPKIRDWDTKVFSIPKIPRSSDGYPESLKIILNALKEKKLYNNPINIEGSKRKDTLEKLLVFLRPTGIVKKNISGDWEMSEEITIWLDSSDNFYLAAILNANIRFFSEILQILFKKSPTQMKEIRKIARDDYKLPWKKASEINNRLGWFQDLGLINYDGYAFGYSITEQGKQFLKSVGYFNHENIVIDIDSTIHETEVPISDWALEFCKLTEEEKMKRKNGIGYFPGNVQSMHDVAYDYLLLMYNPTELTKIVNYSSETYGIKESSVSSILTSLSNLDFIERKTKTQYETTSLGRKFPTDNFEIDFACCVNRKCSFVFEILVELHQENLNVKQLATRGRVSYNYSYKDLSELRKRLHILKNAKLIQEVGIESYGLTNRGSNFYELIKDHIKISNVQQEQTESQSIISESSSFVDKCLNEIRLASRESTDPKRFEKALQVGFGLLGFKVDHLGSSGETDIILHAQTAPKFAYSVTVDAKSTYHSGVSDNSIDFDTIVEHKNKHEANYTAIVAINFQGERVIERARNRGVVLIDVDSLEKLIRWHVDVPLKSDSYKKIFDQNGMVDLKVLEEDRNKIIREGLLLQAIIKCLSDQSSDPFTKGIVHAREIYLLLKYEERFDIPPDLDEITLMLELLSSPLIGCVGIAKEGYYALGSLDDAAQKFDFYLKACNRNNT